MADDLRVDHRLLLAGAPATAGGTARRLLQLYVGLALYGASMALLVRSALGVMPWDVLHQGLAGRLGWSIGAVTIAVGAVVLLAWLPLRQRPGLGTVSNVLVIGVAVDATLAVLPAPTSPVARAGFLVAGVLLNAVATAAYIGVHLGPGPRDGLMTGLVRRTGWSVRRVRTSLEVGVVATGWLLGGTLGPGTVLYAVGIGPLVQVLLPRLSLPLAGSHPPPQPDDHDGDDGEHQQADRAAAGDGPGREDQQ